MNHGFYSFVDLLEDRLFGIGKTEEIVFVFLFFVGKYSSKCQKDRQRQKIKYSGWLRHPNNQLVDGQNLQSNLLCFMGICLTNYQLVQDFVHPQYVTIYRT